MSAPELDPNPAPPADPPGAAPPDKTDLERFIDSLAGFDPAVITSKIDELLGRVDSNTIAAEVKAAVTEGFGDISKQIANLGKLIRQQQPSPSPDPSGGAPAGEPAPPAPAAPPPPGGDPAPSGGGIADTLFGVPKIGG